MEHPSGCRETGERMLTPTQQLLICLVVAHLVGDFLLQTEKDVHAKSRVRVLMKHVVIVTATTYLFCGIWREWRIPAALLLTHTLLDAAKTHLSRNGLRAFLLDQAAHLGIIVLLAGWRGPHLQGLDLTWVRLWPTVYLPALVLLAGVVVAAKTSGIVIGMLVRPFLEQIAALPADPRSPAGTRRGLSNGGYVIGLAERLLIFLFILMDQASGIGFLLAAKSILRFGEVKEARHRMEAEYIIIGTFLSFGLGMLVAYATRGLLLRL
jgi:hypothetical protein